MKKNSPVYVLGFMIAVCTVCGIAISSVQFTMKKTLDANARLTRNRTIAAAFSLETAQRTAVAYDSLLAADIKRDTILGSGRSWELFTRREAPHDVGFIFTGMGFWDMITGIIVLSKDLSAISSFEVIDQKETPGLGARIEEAVFKKQFIGYPIIWNLPEEQRITFGDPVGNKTVRLNAITGATQTSMALERILNSELAAFKTAYDKR